MFTILYTISIHFYHLLIRLASPFNNKANLWISGRKNLLKNIRKTIEPGLELVWFHCASLGEFEQGKPLIEAFREQFPSYKILLTFFSPSGYEIRKRDKVADYIFYLPIDTRKNARRFIAYTHPKMVFFIKYEYWYNYIQLLHNRKVPVYLVSAIFRKSQPFFKFYGAWFRKQLEKISFFFVQDKNSGELLNSIGITNYTISGDTRFDRVFKIALQKREFQEIKNFASNKKLIIAGSTWPADEEHLLNLFSDHETGYRMVIAPHEVDEERILGLIKKAGDKTIRYSINKNFNSYAEIMVIDTVGILSYLYRYAYIAYIGGGFGKGIHNILESVTFGKPVIFGPSYEKFQEARELIALGGAFCFKNQEELHDIIEKLTSDEPFYKKCVTICTDYINSKTGATKKIIDHIINIK
jgi:3-deoxy-D-manno-octulosonic-acid transferase